MQNVAKWLTKTFSHRNLLLWTLTNKYGEKRCECLFYPKNSRHRKTRVHLISLNSLSCFQQKRQQKSPSFLRKLRLQRRQRHRQKSRQLRLSKLQSFSKRQQIQRLQLYRSRPMHLHRQKYLLGQELKKSRTSTRPTTPPSAAPKKPHFQPKAATIEPTKMKESPSPILWEALKMP